MNYIIKAFGDYYRSHTIYICKDFQKREWMFEFFDGTMKRYLSFESGEQVMDYIRKTVPKSVYCSVCAFEQPQTRSGYIYADLAIDIDIPQYISKGKYFCSAGHPSEIVCDNEYVFLRSEAEKVIETMTKDFCLSAKDLVVAFSGKKGYHILVTSDAYTKLDSRERKSIIDYIMGENIIPKQLGYAPVKRGEKWVWTGPKPAAGGWRGRSCKAISSFLKLPYQQMVKLGVSKCVAYQLSKLANREKLAEQGDWGKLFTSKIPTQDVYELIRLSCWYYAPEIDMGVAKDLKRQLRVPDSIHGKSGLVAKKINPDDVCDFDPYNDATLPIKETVKVKLTKDIPAVSLGGYKISGRAGAEVDLPGGLGLSLVCSGVASLSEKL